MAVRAQGSRTLHHADGVDVELARKARLHLVLAEGEHAHAGEKNNGWTGISLLGGPGQRVRGVVLGVFGAIGLKGSFNQRRNLPGIGTGIPREKHWADLRTDEVVRATCAQVCELLSLFGANEFENGRRVCEAPDPALFTGDGTPQIGHDLHGDGSAIFARRYMCAAEHLVAFALSVGVDELSDLVDDRDGVEIARALRLAPCE